MSSVIETGKISRNKCCPGQEEIFYVMTSMDESCVAAEKGLRLSSFIDSQTHSAIMVDAARVRQVVLANLLANAVKFSNRVK